MYPWFLIFVFKLWAILKSSKEIFIISCWFVSSGIAFLINILMFAPSRSLFLGPLPPLLFWENLDLPNAPLFEGLENPLPPLYPKPEPLWRIDALCLYLLLLYIYLILLLSHINEERSKNIKL